MALAAWLRGHSFRGSVRVQATSAADMRRHRQRSLERPPGVASTYAALGLHQSEWSARIPRGRRCSGAFYRPEDSTVVVCGDTLRDLAPRRITHADNMLTTIGITALANIALPGASLYVEYGEGQHRLAEARRREAEHTLVHEFVHALQHQRLGLTEAPRKLTTDEVEARLALVEGDAAFVSWAMTLSRRGSRRPAPRASSAGFIVGLRESLREGAVSEGLPHEVARQLSFRYGDGLRLVSELYRTWKWAAVDAAHFNPPSSTSHVLHPMRYLDGAKPEAIAVPPVRVLESQGYQRVGTDTVGEFLLGSYVSAGGGGPLAARQVGGWRGDQIRVYSSPKGAPAAVWVSSFADGEAAVTAHGAIAKAHARLPDELGSQAMLERTGSRIVVARGVPPDLHADLRSELARLLEPAPPSEATP